MNAYMEVYVNIYFGFMQVKQLQTHQTFDYVICSVITVLWFLQLPHSQFTVKFLLFGVAFCFSHHTFNLQTACYNVGHQVRFSRKSACIALQEKKKPEADALPQFKQFIRLSKRLKVEDEKSPERITHREFLYSRRCKRRKEMLLCCQRKQQYFYYLKEKMSPVTLKYIWSNSQSAAQWWCTSAVICV